MSDPSPSPSPAPSQAPQGEEDQYDPKGEPLYFRLNPCDMARFKFLAPVGDAMASMWYALTKGTDCPCCLASRVLGLMVAAAALASAVTAAL